MIMFHHSTAFIFIGCDLSHNCSPGTSQQIDWTPDLATTEFEVRSAAAVTGRDLATMGSFEVIWKDNNCTSIARLS